MQNLQHFLVKGLCLSFETTIYYAKLDMTISYYIILYYSVIWKFANIFLWIA